MPTALQSLARHVAGIEYRLLSSEALHECRRRLIDSVACAVAARAEPPCLKLDELARSCTGRPGARLWGSGEITTLEMAALANGTRVRYLDHSDTYLGRSAGHPSDMLAALVGVAEGFGRSGGALFEGIVAAYDVYCSLCDAVNLSAHAIDQATAAAVGTAAGAARVLGLDEAAIGQALALALASSLHLYNVRCGTLSDWKGCAGPNGARNGLFAAVLARAGLTGPEAPVEGKGGLAEITGAFEWRPPEQPGRIVDTHLKFHPVCYHGQSAVDAALALRGRAAPEEIVAIEVETYDAAVTAMGGDPGRWAPTTRETADHSLPFTVAVALLRGRLLSADYAPAGLADAATRALMERVRVVARDEFTRAYPQRAPARVTIRGRDGTAHEHLQERPLGHAANPLPDAALEAKFFDMTAGRAERAQAQQLLERLWRADSVPRVAELVDALCPMP